MAVGAEGVISVASNIIPRQITRMVNAITAGWLSTEEISEEEANQDPLSRFIPLRRLGHPREVGPLLVYLASDACDFVTGQAIAVDGGAIAHG